jgi:hypothetical protein
VIPYTNGCAIGNWGTALPALVVAA